MSYAGRFGYDGTLCPCRDCEYMPFPCDTCGDHDSTTEWHGWLLCDECLEQAKKEEADDGPMD